MHNNYYIAIVMIVDTIWTHEDNKKSRNLVYQVFRDCSGDLDWIQTSNLLSRNQVRYSVAPQGLFYGCKYRYNYMICKLKIQIKSIFLNSKIGNQLS